MLAASAVAWLACPVPRHSLLSIQAILLIALGYVLGPIAALVITVRLVDFVLPKTAVNVRHAILRSSFSVLWLPPLAIFLFERSAFAVVLITLATVSIARLLLFYSRTSGQNARTEIPDTRQRLHIHQPPSLLQRMGLPFAAALLLQTGIAAAWLDETDAAVALLAMATVLLAASFVSGIPRKAVSSRRLRRLPLMIVLAVLFAAVGLLPYLRVGPLTYGMAMAHDWLNAVFADRPRYGQSTPDSTKSSPQPGDPGNGDYSGVILWPEGGPQAVILAPPPPELVSSSAPNLSTKPLSIPFRGAYWFFKSPRRRPPEHSFKTHGTPAKMGLHSSDWEPLLMEAHQDFSTPVNLDCCSGIQVEISNRDRYPRTVWLEVLLSDTSQPYESSLSLGERMVTSTQPWSDDENRPARSETLTFEIPAAPELRSFNELTIRFHLSLARAHSSARIAIDRFTLMPKGSH